MDLGLKGKVALITGGSHGIGFGIAKALAEEGCKIAICARDPMNVMAADEKLKLEGVEVIGVSADVLKVKDVKRVMNFIIKTWGTIHILVNNVGGGGRWGTTFEGTPEKVWVDVYNKNAMAAIRFTKLALPFMVKQAWGRVVTIASILGKEGGGKPWFNMAKSAEISLMKTLAMDSYLWKFGVTFNSVAPGYIETLGKNNEFPSERVGQPEDVANLVAYLCSEKAWFINGSCITVDGGESKSF